MSLITLMGSGELSPTMVKVHREILTQHPGKPTFVDTPFGFQENADEITTKVQEYFLTSLNTEIRVASFRNARTAAVGEIERMLDLVRNSTYLFSGPGSPSYALENWQAADFGEAARSCLDGDGAITLASAAAVTAGSHAVPVYEIYKVGAQPFWLPGLDLLGHIGISAAVIPHFDNAEGGTHDTRFCYLGQRRFNELVTQLPYDTSVIGVDEHTSLQFDSSSSTASVLGRGKATFSSGDTTTCLGPGETAPIGDLLDTGPRSVLAAPMDRLVSFDDALRERDAAKATDIILEQAPGPEQNAMIVRLGNAAAEGLTDRTELIRPLVDDLLALRDSLRAARRWDEGDTIRDALAAYGVVVADGPDGTTWALSELEHP